MNISKTKSVLFVALIAFVLPIHAATNDADSVISNYHAQIAVLQASNDLDHAQVLAKELVELVQKTYGAHSTNYANALTALSDVFYYRNDYTNAEPLYIETLAINEKILGPEHSGVASSLDNIAGVYIKQNRFAQAEPLCKRALAITEKAFGPDHPEVATSLNHLALLYNSQGQYAATEPLLKRSLAIWEKSLGPDHSYVASSLNNLAGLYNNIGQYAAAEQFLKRALAIKEKTLGPEHPNVANSLNNLAMVYDSQGQYAAAEPLFKRALTINEKVLGPDHPYVAKLLNDLAGLYNSQGKYAAAEPLLVRALETLERASGIAGGEEYAGALRSKQQKIVGYYFDAFMYNAATSGTTSVERAFWAMELVRSRAFLDMVLRSAAARQSGLSTADAQRDSEINAAMRVFEAPHDKLSATDTGTVSAIEDRLSDLRVQRHALDQEFATRYPRYMAMRKPVRMDVAEAQRVLASNEVMIAYWDGSNNVFACAIGKTNFVFSAVSKRATTFGDALQTVMAAFTPYGTTNDCTQYQSAALTLYDLLLSPLMSNAWVRDAEMTYIVPHGALCALPFEALVCSTNGTNWRDLDYVFKKMRLAYVPSAMVLRAIRQDEAAGRYVSPARQPAVLFGDPIYQTNQLEEGVGTRVLAMHFMLGRKKLTYPFSTS